LLVPAHSRVTGNEMPYIPAEWGSSTPFVRLKPTAASQMEMSGRVYSARAVYDAWNIDNMQSVIISGPLLNRTVELLWLNRNRLRSVTELSTDRCHLKGHQQSVSTWWFKLQQVLKL
jgi:hypothetical protein